MEIRVLNYFLTVAREENITRASEVLYLTQPTLSRQLTQLEEELGTQLLIRGKRKVTLTEAGVLFKKRAEEIMEMIGKAEKELKEQDELINGKISIGSGEMEASKIFPSLFKNFNEKYPKVSYELYTGNADQIKEKIDQGLLDFGLLLEPVNIEKYDFIRLGVKEKWVALMKPDDPYAEKEFVTPWELSQKPLIMVKRAGVRNELANWFGDYYEKLSVFAEHNMTNHASILVEQGLGYALVLEGSVYFYDKNKICYKPLFPELTAGSVIVWKKNQVFSHTSKRFLEYIKNFIKEDEVNTK